MKRWLKRIALVTVIGIVLGVGVLYAWISLKDAWWLEASPYGDVQVADTVGDAPLDAGYGWQVRLARGEVGRQLIVSHRDEPDRARWASVPGRAFVAGAQGVAELHEARGMASVDDTIEQRCIEQSVTAIEVVDGAVQVSGEVTCDQGSAGYTLAFRGESASRLAFDLRLADSPAGLNRALLIKHSTDDEGFFGFGEQFTYFDLKGRRVPIVISEQGIGRGTQPITAGADLTADGAGGDWSTTYIAVPQYITSTLEGFSLSEDAVSFFDLRRSDAAVVSIMAPGMSGHIFRAPDPLGLIEAYTEVSGRMRPVPRWVHDGAIIGMQGGTEKVRRIAAKAKKAGLPVAAFWLQDWVGQRKTSFGKQLWWSWTLDREHYPQWRQLIAELKRDGISVLTYVNPFLVDVAERGGGQRNLFAEARERGYLVQRESGEPYMIVNTSFSAGLLDLSNAAARDWFVEVMKDEVLSVGARGWMADFGEGLPFDAVLADKSLDPAAYHNRYPADWAELNRRAIREAGRERDLTFFMRAGYRTSPGSSTLFWLGDQMVSWDANDGLRSAIVGLLSGGVSGFSINHSDIGGYTTITHPISDYHRGAELHQRWAEFAAMTPIFRTHEGNRPDVNVQFHAPGVFEHFTAMARLHQCWIDERERLMKQASDRGWPVNRHMWLHYPERADLRAVRWQQFLIGDSLLMAPVTAPGEDRVEVVLPDAGWVHLWTGQVMAPGTATVDAPIGQPAVFYRQLSPVGGALRACMALPAPSEG